MRHVLYDHHKEHIENLGVANPPVALDIDNDDYDAVFAGWKQTLPDADDATLHTKTLGHFAWKNHSTVKEIVPEIITRGTEFVDAVRLAKKFGWAIIGLLAILILATLFAPKAHGQFSHINSITATNNDNSQQGFFASPFTFKAGANCSFSVSGSTATFNCSGGAAGAGGVNTQVQWNSTGSLAGISSLTTDGTITTALAGADWLFADLTTPTKKFQFDASNISAVTTRTMNVPDANATFAQAISAVSHKFITQMSAQGVFTLAQPDYSDLTGTPTLPVTIVNASHKWLNSYTSTTGAFTQTQPDYSDLTGVPTLPANTTATASNFFTAYNSTTGAFTKAQPAFSDISGSVAAGQMPALTGAITSSGVATSPGKADLLDSQNFCQAAGANTTTYTCSLSPAISAYVTGTHYRFKADVANTAASTINLNALGAKTIKKAAGGITTDIVANDLQAGQWVDLVYDGTNMQMQSTLGNAAAGGAVTAGNGIDVTSSVVSEKPLCVQTSIAGGDTITSAGNFATTCSLPSSIWSVGTTIEIWSFGTLATGASGGAFFKYGVKFGSTTITPGAGPFLGNNLTWGWHLAARIICISTGVSGTVEAQAIAMMADTAGGSQNGPSMGFNSATVTIDTTATQTLEIAETAAITATGNTTTMRQLIVKVTK